MRMEEVIPQSEPNPEGSSSSSVSTPEPDGEILLQGAVKRQKRKGGRKPVCRFLSYCLSFWPFYFIIHRTTSTTSSIYSPVYPSFFYIYYYLLANFCSPFAAGTAIGAMSVDICHLRRAQAKK